MMDVQDKETRAEKIYGLLAEQHCLPQWIIVPELRGSTAYYNMREIDAFAVSCWTAPSPGYSIAYEIKVDRQDFKREINDPDKRATFVANSNQFYFVTLPEVVNVEEIPPECGLIYATDRLRIQKIAPQRELKPNFYDPMFIASLLRNVVEKNKSYKLGSRKLFKYAGRELTHEELVQLIEKESKFHIDRLDKDAYDKATMELRENVKLEYNNAMRAICHVLGRSTTPIWSRNDKEIWNYDTLVNDIISLKAKGVDGGSDKLKRIRQILDEQ